MEEQEVGKVTHFFTHLNVAIVQVTAPVKVGDKIHIKGATSDFQQTLDSMQIQHEKVEEAKPGDDIGLKMVEHTREGDTIFKVEE